MINFQFYPVPVFETHRLILKALVKEDAPNLWRLRNTDAVMKYIDRPRQKDIEETEMFIETIHENIKANTAINWGIYLKEDPDDLIGTVGFYRNEPAKHRGEIGYMLDNKHWRKGYMNEAIQTALQYGFDTIQFNTIIGCIDPNNEASRQILLKNGFVKEACFKQNYFYQDQFKDTEVYTKFKTPFL